MDIRKLQKFLEKNKQPAFRLTQIQKAIFQDGFSAWQKISSLPKNLRDELDNNFKILSFTIKDILKTRDGRSVKALLRLGDNNFVETVLISPKPGIWSACISSQVGCPLQCRFCATGRKGFKRNLTAEEIIDQILFWKQYLKSGGSSLNNIVYMGMGEPFLNWENIKKSLKDLTIKGLFGFGSRSISVSTAGIPEGILKLAENFPQVNLAISLHFADNKKRSEFMPINLKYDLNKLKKALRNYFLKTNRKIFIEYIMLADINDSPKDAELLINYLKSIGNLKLIHVNLIKYNQANGELNSSSAIKINNFKNYLLRQGINITIRKSLGVEIQGACGQLAGNSKS
jgi:23S rRNA (adenine(2503)-C(2))-methyltransferase